MSAPVTAGPDEGGDPAAPRLRDGLQRCLAVFAATRIGLFLLSVMGVGLTGVPAGQPIGVPGWAAPPMGPGWHLLFTATERQDALWFLRIATHGYRTGDTSAAFFPLYPGAIKGVSLLTFGHPLLAALLVSNACFLGALILLYDLTAREFSKDVAGRSIVLLALFPTAFFLMAPYSESLFLLLALASFRSARMHRWGWAAVFALLATLTRSVGIVLAPALLVEAIQQWRAGGRPLPRAVAASAAPAVGLGLVFAGWWRWGGDALAPLHVQSAWRPRFSLPWASLWRGLRFADLYGSYWLLDAVVVVAAIVALVAGIRRVRATYLVFAAGALVLPLFAEFPDRPLLSMPRFICVLFPVIWVPSLLAERRPWVHTVAIASFAAGFGLFAVLFVNWQYVF
jgi:hypothetical protein